MFRDRRNDRNIVLGIGRIQQRIESSSPRRDFTSDHQHGYSSNYNYSKQGEQGVEQDVKLLLAQFRFQEVNEGKDLAKSENTESLKKNHLLQRRLG